MNLYSTLRCKTGAVRALAGENGRAGRLFHSEFGDPVESDKIQIVNLGRRSLVPMAQFAMVLRLAD